MVLKTGIYDTKKRCYMDPKYNRVGNQVRATKEVFPQILI